MLNKIKKILIVDDEPDILDYLSFMIGQDGYQTETASGGIEGFNKFESNAFDLVITDIRMPEGDGITLIKEIRAINKSIPIFCVSGYSEISSTELLDLGVNAVFGKPFNREKILKKLHDSLSI